MMREETMHTSFGVVKLSERGSARYERRVREQLAKDRTMAIHTNAGETKPGDTPPAEVMGPDGEVKDHPGQAALDEAVAENSVELAASISEICTLLGIKPKSRDLADMFQAFYDWAQSMSKELGCANNIDAIFEAMKAQKASLRSLGEYSVSRLSAKELEQCKKRGISPLAFAKAKADVMNLERKRQERMRLADERFKKDEAQNEARRNKGTAEAPAPKLGIHGLTEDELSMCERRRIDPAVYAKKFNRKGAAR